MEAEDVFAWERSLLADFPVFFKTVVLERNPGLATIKDETCHKAVGCNDLSVSSDKPLPWRQTHFDEIVRRGILGLD